MNQDKLTKILPLLKYATLLMFGIFLTVAAASIFRGTQNSALEGRVLPQDKEPERVFFDPPRVTEGFTAPADTHVVFTVPLGIQPITRVILLGGDLNDEKRYWGYCFSGNENANREKNYTGRKLYDGKFFYSKGERDARRPNPRGQEDIIDITLGQSDRTRFDLASEIEIFEGGEMCYLMSSLPLPVGLDDDNDELNNRLETDLKSDPNVVDSDGDSIPDGKEVLIMKTSPITDDTDFDGLPDYLEDLNQNGQMDATETSALHPDTDRDELCDGDGSGRRCPEEYNSPIKGEDKNQNGLVDQGETDPRKFDTDKNGVNDKDQAWFEYEKTL